MADVPTVALAGGMEAAQAVEFENGLLIVSLIDEVGRRVAVLCQAVQAEGMGTFDPLGRFADLCAETSTHVFWMEGDAAPITAMVRERSVTAARGNGLSDVLTRAITTVALCWPQVRLEWEPQEQGPPMFKKRVGLALHACGGDGETVCGYSCMTAYVCLPPLAVIWYNGSRPFRHPSRLVELTVVPFAAAWLIRPSGRLVRMPHRRRQAPCPAPSAGPAHLVQWKGPLQGASRAGGARGAGAAAAGASTAAAAGRRRRGGGR